MRITGRVARSLFILLIAVATPGVIYADDATPSVKLLVGRSAIVDIGTPIQRVSLTSADVADAMVTASNQLLVNGKMPGTISMFVWERNGALHQYEIVVQRDLARLNEQMKRLFPNEAIDAQSNGKSIVLSGYVSTKETAALAASVAGGYVDKADDVVNLLKLQEGMVSNQVLLRVRFAEVSRTAVTDLGVGFFTSALGVHNTLGRVTTNQVPTPGFDELKWTKSSSDFGGDVTQASGKNTFSDFLNVFLFSEKYDIGVVIKALQTKGLFQSLAEPNLVSESGKEASFLAGGEFPVPIAQGTGGNVAVSVIFKEFGIRLNFTPVITGDRVHLKVRPEVSTLDFANGVVLQGFRIPALSTRRTETELELADGQTFAIAGLLNNQVNSTMQKIPGIGDIPILGLLFKSKAAQKDQTELVVMITPQILPKNSAGVTAGLPKMPEHFLPALPDKKQIEMPPPAFPRPAGAAAAPRSDDGSAAGAAATVGAIMRPKPLPVTVQGPPPPASPVAAQPRPATSAAAPVAGRAVKPEASKPEARRVDAAAQKKNEERDAKLAQEQAKRDLEAARAQAKKDLEASRLQAKRDGEAARIAGEEAKRQAELQKKRQKALDEAAALAKAAEERYQAELAKKQQKEDHHDQPTAACRQRRARNVAGVRVRQLHGTAFRHDARDRRRHVHERALAGAERRRLRSARRRGGARL